MASTGDVSKAPLATPETLSECSSIDSESWKGECCSIDSESWKGKTGPRLHCLRDETIFRFPNLMFSVFCGHPPCLSCYLISTKMIFIQTIALY